MNQLFTIKNTVTGRELTMTVTEFEKHFNMEHEQWCKVYNDGIITELSIDDILDYVNETSQEWELIA